jgi:hypothetical protein
MVGQTNDLSLNDSFVVIGISVPPSAFNSRITSPQTAVSETEIIASYESRTPSDENVETPEIMITPAAEVSHWSPDTATPHSRRVASSVYSRPVSYADGTPYEADAPPMPQIPSSYNITKSPLSPEEEVSFSPEKWRKRLRITSAETVFEEDMTPILTRKERSNAAESGGMKLTMPTDTRRSVGWWNTVVSPFLGRSETVAEHDYPSRAPKPVLPSIETTSSAYSKSGVDRKASSVWRKLVSPKSPLSSTTIASDAWWDSRRTIDGGPKWFEACLDDDENNHTYHSQQSNTSGTLPFMFRPELDDSSIPDEMNGGRLGRYESFKEAPAENSTLSPTDREAPFILDLSTMGLRDTSDRNGSGDISGRTANQPIATNGSRQGNDYNSKENDHATPPPPYSPPKGAFPRYRAVYPPGHAAAPEQPSSPGPMPPGLQRAMATRGAIALEEVPLTPAARRPINLNSGYPGLPPRPMNNFMNPVDLHNASEKARKAEARRRRHEKEDAVANKVGGLWRGRGCLPNRGCYGRRGAEGRKRKRWCLGITLIIVVLITLVAVLAVQLKPKPTATEAASTQWLNLTAFPPIYTGVSTVAAVDNTISNTGCVYPKTVWSCALPKELQPGVSPNKPDQPNFRFFIQWDNSSQANASWGGPVAAAPTVRRSAGQAVTASQLMKAMTLRVREAINFNPSPMPPAQAEQVFLGNTTDGVMSDNKAGEPTPFYITLLDAVGSSNTSLLPRYADEKGLTRRQAVNITGEFQDLVKPLPAPEVGPDGTAAPANLYPFSQQQPLRFYDRGLISEHFGFYTYYNRSIFLKSTALLNATNAGDGEVPDDQDGGCRESEARFKCTWQETRFLVKMWTRKNATAKLLGGAPQAERGINATQRANDFSKPGTFPYPVTIVVDRHGGDPVKKGVFCYEIDVRQKPVAGSGKVRPEFRSFGGQVINPAPSDFGEFSGKDTDVALGGFDGGNAGCSCEWRNWEAVTSV